MVYSEQNNPIFYFNLTPQLLYYLRRHTLRLIDFENTSCIIQDKVKTWEQRKLGDVFKEYSEKKHEELPPLTIIQGGGIYMEPRFESVQKKLEPVTSVLTRQERLVALKYLDEHGAMQIAKSYVRLCEFFGISKFTLYSQLDEVRNGKADQTADGGQKDE